MGGRGPRSEEGRSASWRAWSGRESKLFCIIYYYLSKLTLYYRSEDYWDSEGYSCTTMHGKPSCRIAELHQRRRRLRYSVAVGVNEAYEGLYVYI